MSKKRKLTEGKIKRFFDKIVYSIINDANESVVNSLRNDPEMGEAIEEFEGASKKLSDTLQRFADKLERGEV